jgi:hypothetical protein
MKQMLVVAGLAISAVVAQPLYAMGGGSTSSSMPSQTTPQYDPAVEYRNGVAALETKDFKAAKTAFDRVLTMVKVRANFLRKRSRSTLPSFPRISN